MMKVIYLDLDGVLIRFGNTDKIRKTRAEKRQSGCIFDFDEDLVLNLKQIIKETNAKIIISSSWRHDMDRVKQSFLEANLDYNLVIGRTPDGLGYGRGNEVLHHLFWHNRIVEKQEEIITHWVMIDDDSFDSKCVNRLGMFVHTKTSQGLTIEKMKESIKILNK